MNFIPAMNLRPMMVIVQPGRIMPNELWTVRKVDEANMIIHFYEHDLALGYGQDPMVQIPVIGERLNWPSQKIAFSARRNEDRYNTSWQDEMQEKQATDVVHAKPVPTGEQKEETLEVLQNCIDNAVEAAARFVHRGHAAGYWDVNEKMTSVHLGLENEISKIK